MALDIYKYIYIYIYICIYVYIFYILTSVVRGRYEKKKKLLLRRMRTYIYISMRTHIYQRTGQSVNLNGLGV
jgi:hypothetical protein